MAGTPLTNVRFFEELCGNEFSTIVLATTMWDEVDPEIGEQREKELREIYWKTMIDRGSTVKRFLSTPVSASDLLRPIVNQVGKRPVKFKPNCDVRSNHKNRFVKDSRQVKVEDLSSRDVVVGYVPFQFCVDFLTISCLV